MADITLYQDASQVSTYDDLSAMGDIADEVASRGTFQDYQVTLTENTKRRQKSDLDAFARYLTEAGKPRSAEELYRTADAWRGMSYGIVQGFMKWQLKQGYAIGSVNVRLATIKQYCAIATKAGAITESKLNLIKTVKGYSSKVGRNIDEDRDPTRIGAKKAVWTSLSPAHADLLADQDNPRDALLMCLLLDHNLRCSEVASLLVQNIDTTSGQMIFYRKKVHKIQTVRLSAGTLKAAMAYLAVEGVRSQHYLFMGYKGQPITTKGINERVKLLGERLGIDHLSPHDCRHYWTTDAIRNGTNIKAVQTAGGWTSPTMVLRYAEEAVIANEGVKLSRGKAQQ